MAYTEIFWGFLRCFNDSFVSIRCVVWTGDGRVFFYNPSQRMSVWEKPEELLDRADVDKLLQNPPDAGKNICIQHRWEGKMGSSQHKSPHRAGASRRGLDVATSAEISPSRHT